MPLDVTFEADTKDRIIPSDVRPTGSSSGCIIVIDSSSVVARRRLLVPLGDRQEGNKSIIEPRLIRRRSTLGARADLRRPR